MDNYECHGAAAAAAAATFPRLTNLLCSSSPLLHLVPPVSPCLAQPPQPGTGGPPPRDDNAAPTPGMSGTIPSNWYGFEPDDDFYDRHASNLCGSGCNPGSACSRSNGSVNSFAYVCSPCDIRGILCPFNMTNFENVIERLLSPAGYYTDNATHIAECPLGKYCDAGTVTPSDCETQGYFCPARTTKPTANPCSAGYYCPTPLEQLVCPAGYFCRANRIEPTKCPSLALCEEGSSKPEYTYVIAVLFVVALAALVFVRRYALGSMSKRQSLQAVAIFNLTKNQQLYRDFIMSKLDRVFQAAAEASSVLGRKLDVKMWMEGRGEALAAGLTIECQNVSFFVPGAPNDDELAENKLDTAQSVVPFTSSKWRRAVAAGDDDNDDDDDDDDDRSLRISSNQHSDQNYKQLLTNVTTTFRRGTMTALMGSSGCGKSTLMNVVYGSAHYGTQSGRVLVNGTDQSLDTIRHLVGFVPQDDIVYEDLSVRQNIMYSAKLRLPSTYSTKRIEESVDHVISILGLSHVASSIVGSVEHRGISGGQRKRVSIGMELVAEPVMLFMDEPTSGLDASTSVDLLDTLQNLASLGMTIVCVIHQPRYSIFEMFDSVLLLLKGGHVAYDGPPIGARHYFSQLGFEFSKHGNPADEMMDALSGVLPCSLDRDFRPRKLRRLWIENKDLFLQDAVDFAKPHALALTVSRPTSAIADDDAKQGTVAASSASSSSSTQTSVTELALQKSLEHAGDMPYEDALQILCSAYRELSAQTFRRLASQTQRGRQLLRQYSSSRIVHGGASGGLPTMAAAPYLSKEQIEDVMDTFMNQYGLSPANLINVEQLLELLTQVCASPDALKPIVEPILSTESDSKSCESESFQHCQEAASAAATGTSIVMLPQRAAQSFSTQLIVCFARSIDQRHGRFGEWVQQLLVVILGGIMMGFLYGGTVEPSYVTLMFLMVVMFLGTLAAVDGLRVVGPDAVVLSREFQSGLSPLAYLIAKYVDGAFDILVRATAFFTTFFLLTSPLASYTTLFPMMVLVYWLNYAWGIVASLIVPVSYRALTASMFSVLTGGLFGGVNPTLESVKGGPMEYVMAASYGRWATEALSILELDKVPSYVLAGKTYQLESVGYSEDDLQIDYAVVITMGVIWMLISLLVLLDRKYRIFTSTTLTWCCRCGAAAKEKKTEKESRRSHGSNTIQLQQV
jgi:ABC-type multidrug transport system ATPase subunit